MPEEQNRRIRKIKRSKRAAVKLSKKDKESYLQQVEKLYIRGVSVEEVSNKLNISKSSIYRWRRQQNDISKSSNGFPNAASIKIEHSIENLCEPDVHRNPKIIEALLQFIIWLRWPSEPECHAIAMVNCLCSYIRQKTNVEQIDHLEGEHKDLLLKYATVDLLAKLSSPQAELNPNFEIVTGAKSRNDDRRFFAQITSYLISKNLKGRTRPHSPTLESMQILVEAGAFGQDWVMSPRTFEKLWRLRARSVPFLYIEHNHSQFDWSLDPQDSDFAESVDEIISSLDNFHIYISRVAWAIRRIEEVLDPRAFHRIAFPALPENAGHVEAEPPELPLGVRKKLKQLF